MKTEDRRKKRDRRHRRVRGKIFGTKEKPRLCVFRSNKHIYAQLINDTKGVALTVASDLELKPEKKKKKTKKRKSKEEKDLSGKRALSFRVGQLLAEKAKKIGIKKVVFDKGGYKYHGRVKALAEGAREGDLVF